MEKIKNCVFNTPLELGIRLLHIFDATTRALDLQRLIYYNYLLIHSADISDSPNSIHPALPNRSCEMLVSRRMIKSGLNLLLSKGLIEIKYSKTGIYYKANKETSFISDHFNSQYAKKLKNRAAWLIQKFDKISDKQLNKIMNENIGQWGSEFIDERTSIKHA